MEIVYQGVVHGKTIELHEHPGIADGQAVEVVLRPNSKNPKSPSNLKSPTSAAGMLANYPEMDGYLEEVMKARRIETEREVPE